MTVAGCALCGRFISISVSPVGNPVALADPETWAIRFGVCAQCGKYFCDRCIDAGGVCPLCGGKLDLHKPGDGYAQELMGRL